MQFKEIADMYYGDNKDTMKPSAYSSSRWLYTNFIRDYWDDRDIESINSRETQKFYNYVAKLPKKNNPDETLGEHTVRDIVGLFKTICYYAMREGVMQEFAFKLRRPHGIREVESTQAAYMPDEDCKNVIALCSDGNFKRYAHAKIFALIAITAGLRIGEVCGLKWEDIDIESGTAKIRRTIVRIYDGETGKSHIHIGDPKSKTSKRDVFLLEITAKVLREYREYKGVTDASDFVLGGKTPTEPRTLRQEYVRFMKAIGIQYIHPHALRHTFCTNALSNGCDVKTVSKLLGHSDTHITLDVYAHITNQQMESTVNKLNSIFGKDNIQ